MKKGCIAGFIVVLLLCAAAFFFGPRITRNVMLFLYPKPHSQIVEQKAAEFQLDENLIYAVMKAESGFDENAESHADAHGLMQLTEDTFQWISSIYPPENGGDDIFDREDNIHCGCALLRLLLDEYGQNTDVALCAYNAGIGTVDGWLSNTEISEDGVNLHKIPYPETAAYLKKVKEYYSVYQKLYED